MNGVQRKGELGGSPRAASRRFVAVASVVLVTLAAADPARGAEVSNEGGETVAGWVKSPANPIFRPDPKALWERERVTACQVVRQGDWHVMFYIGFRDVDHAQIGLVLHEGEDLGF